MEYIEKDDEVVTSKMLNEVLDKYDEEKGFTTKGELSHNGKRIIQEDEFDENNKVINEKIDTEISEVNQKIDTDIATVNEKIDSNIATVNEKISNTYTKQEVIDAIVNKVSELIANSDTDFDTLQEMSAWLSEHKQSAAEMNREISEIKTDLSTVNEKIDSEIATVNEKISNTYTKQEVIDAIVNKVDISVAKNINIGSNSVIGEGKPSVAFTGISNVSNIFPQDGVYIANKENESSGIHINEDNIVMWTPCDMDAIRVYDEDDFGNDELKPIARLDSDGNWYNNDGYRMVNINEFSNFVDWVESKFERL